MTTRLVSAFLLLWGNVCLGQTEMGHSQHMHQTAMDDSSHMNKKHMTEMSHSFSRNLPMARNGSGTGWNPDAAPMYAIMEHSGEWMFMFHGDVFPRYLSQDIFSKGTRGAHLLDAPNMLMAMGQRNVGRRGLFHFNVMLSADALIAGQEGYPLLFQTGESAHGKPLVDRQHPHDLFAELSVSYAHALSQKADVFLYVGYPGEPTLGPVTFMHRISGRFMPDAPISHHWVDATHITYGMATLGLRYGIFKIEGASFTGREPDENRFNFDKPLFNSWSGRLSMNPNRNWALQVSHGYIKSPEQLRPTENVQRTTASATYARPLCNGFFAATALWGMNTSEGHASNAALLEATWKPGALALYSRYEWVQKSVEELNLPSVFYGDEHNTFPLQALTIGGSYDVLHTGAIVTALGVQASVYRAPGELLPLYGNMPVGAEVFLHLYPAAMGK